MHFYRILCTYSSYSLDRFWLPSRFCAAFASSHFWAKLFLQNKRLILKYTWENCRGHKISSCLLQCKCTFIEIFVHILHILYIDFWLPYCRSRFLRRFRFVAFMSKKMFCFFFFSTHSKFLFSRSALCMRQSRWTTSWRLRPRTSSMQRLRLNHPHHHQQGRFPPEFIPLHQFFLA